MKRRTVVYVVLGIIVLHLIALILIFTKPKNRANPIPIKRYDVALMAIDTNNVGKELHRLYKAYPLFLEGADLDDAYNQQQIFNFVTDPRSKELLTDVQKKYPNLDGLEKTFGQSFEIYKKLFDGKPPIPSIYTYLSYLDYENRVIFQDSILVIALDMYLGADYKHYDAAALPKYIRERLDSRFIPADVMKTVAFRALGVQPMQTLLDHLIYQGKVIYFLKKTLPDVDFSTLFGYTQDQLKWCEKSETMMWNYLVGARLLYEQDNFKYRNFVSEAPTVQVFPGSPGRVGHFVGYQIVKQYMENTGQTLPELFAEKDTPKILKLSNYRP